jgi:hypothetical protein
MATVRRSAPLRTLLGWPIGIAVVNWPEHTENVG